MVLIASDDRRQLDAVVASIVSSMQGVFDVLAIERGDALRATFARGERTIEHFGFVDGISQPIMIKQDLDDELAKRGSANWNPAAPLSLALVAEPDRPTNYGSFMVYRKLEQNVKAFWSAIDELTAVSSLDTETAGAMAVGRFRDGTPLLPTKTVDSGSDGNDFHYDQDPDGGQCPFHAHIRKTNPRGDIARIIGAPAPFERARRIARRGITYGARPDLEPGAQLPRPSGGVGLLFMCFQSTLDQFAIQQEGSDSNDFVRPATGPDAAIGQNPLPVAQTWPSNGTAHFSVANFVKLLGGEYFFAPSMEYMEGLDKKM